MPGAQDEDVLSFAVAAPGGGIVLHLVEVECGKDVRGGHGPAGVAGFGQANHTQDVPAHLRGNDLEFLVGFSHNYIVVINNRRFNMR